MQDDFDPYRKWLGIPREEQPPNHYRLLGVPPFEDDLEAISHAADQRMAYVRTLALSEHAELSQRVLNELAAARVCLLASAKKAAYDAMLRARQWRPPPPPAVAHPPAVPQTKPMATQPGPMSAPQFAVPVPHAPAAQPIAISTFVYDQPSPATPEARFSATVVTRYRRPDGLPRWALFLVAVAACAAVLAGGMLLIDGGTGESKTLQTQRTAPLDARPRIQKSAKEADPPLPQAPAPARSPDIQREPEWRPKQKESTTDQDSENSEQRGNGSNEPRDDGQVQAVPGDDEFDEPNVEGADLSPSVTEPRYLLARAKKIEEIRASMIRARIRERDNPQKAAERRLKDLQSRVRRLEIKLAKLQKTEAAMNAARGANRPTANDQAAFAAYRNKLRSNLAEQKESLRLAQAASPTMQPVDGTEIERQVDADLAERLDDPAFGAPFLDCFGALLIGQFGVVREVEVDGDPLNFKLIRVIDAKNMLVRQLGLGRTNTPTVWIDGIDTRGYADNTEILLPDVFEVTGTREYTQAGTETKTLSVLEPLDVSVPRLRDSQDGVGGEPPERPGPVPRDRTSGKTPFGRTD